jgi:preprotein translocase subunit SecA
VLDGEDLRENMMSMLRQLIDSSVTDALAASGGIVDADSGRTLLAAFQGIYFPRGAWSPAEGSKAQQTSDEIYDLAVKTYEAKEAAYGANLMRELERVVMLRVVDEYWMDNIDAMDDLKQGIGLRAYGQHDPVIAYKEEGYEMFQAMVTAIREETVRRMFLVQVRTNQEVKRERVAKETGTAAATQSQVKKEPVRNKAKKVGPNDPCPCGSGKKYKKCCMHKDKTAE